MSQWISVRLSSGKLTGGTDSSSLVKRYTTQWEHNTLVNTLQLLAPTLNSRGGAYLREKEVVFVAGCVSVCICPYVCVYILYSCARACVCIWVLLREISRLYPAPSLGLSLMFSLPLPEHSRSHRATLRLIAKYIGCCFRCWQQSLLKWLPFWLIGIQYPVILYSLILSFTKQALIHHLLYSWNVHLVFDAMFFCKHLFDCTSSIQVVSNWLWQLYIPGIINYFASLLDDKGYTLCIWMGCIVLWWNFGSSWTGKGPGNILSLCLMAIFYQYPQ